MNLYYLADSRDTLRLSTEDIVEPAHTCHPKYFDTADDAYLHPAAASLTVHSCPAVETIPGARVGADIADAVMAGDVYKAVAAAVREICVVNL